MQDALAAEPFAAATTTAAAPAPDDCGAAQTGAARLQVRSTTVLLLRTQLCTVRNWDLYCLIMHLLPTKRRRSDSDVATL